MAGSFRLAVLIDGDNAKAVLFPQMLAEIGKHGEIMTCRVYGDLKKSHMAKWIDIQPQYNLELRQQRSYAKSKNATDMALVIDAISIFYTRKEINGFCIASDDGDFAPLVDHLQREELFVLGIGTKAVSPALVKVCENFVRVEKPQNKSLATSANNGDTMPKALKAMLRKAIDAAKLDDGWASFQQIGQFLNLDPAFLALTTGPKRISKIVQAYPNDFEIEERESKKGNNVTHIQLK